MPNFIDRIKERSIEVMNNRLVPEEVKSARLAICLECDSMIKLTRQCGKCFCIVDAKVMVKKTSCPIGKWGKWEKAAEE